MARLFMPGGHVIAECSTTRCREVQRNKVQHTAHNNNNNNNDDDNDDNYYCC